MKTKELFVCVCTYQSNVSPFHFFVVVAAPPSLPEPSSLKKASSIRASLHPIILRAYFFELSMM